MPGHPLHTPVLAWFDAHARDLPWRAPDRTPWGVLVSEVMLQQTQVARVLPVWLRWMERWPSPGDLADEPAAEAIRAWDRLGYPRRALRLHQTATAIWERHGGEVPDDHDALLALPGVGSYTAAAVATFAFGQRHAVVDTNVRRVQARAVTGAALPAPSLSAAELALAERLVPDEPAAAAHWAVAVMELGALVCTARAPACGGCPVAHDCEWRRRGTPAHPGAPRRGQRYLGTDRYVRGVLLATLRSREHPVARDELLAAVPDAALHDSATDPGQRDRCLRSLLADGLAVLTPAGTVGLPQR